jgi:hypothetical protein
VTLVGEERRFVEGRGMSPLSLESDEEQSESHSFPRCASPLAFL